MTSPQTTEGVRPVAGDHFRHAAALDVGGTKRRKLLALVSAYRDAGQASVKTRELAARLDWDRRKVDVLARRLAADGYLKRSNSGRWRLADEVLATVKAAKKARSA